MITFNYTGVIWEIIKFTNQLLIKMMKIIKILSKNTGNTQKNKFKMV